MKKVLLSLFLIGISLSVFAERIANVTFINNTDKYISLRGNDQKEIIGIKPGGVFVEMLDIDIPYLVKYKTNRGKVKSLGVIDNAIYMIKPHSIVNTEITIAIDSDGKTGSLSNMKGQLSLGICKKNSFKGDISCRLDANNLKDLKITFNQKY